MDVLFAVPPFVDITRPAIGVSLLQAEILQRGFSGIAHVPHIAGVENDAIAGDQFAGEHARVAGDKKKDIRPAAATARGQTDGVGAARDLIDEELRLLGAQADKLGADKAVPAGDLAFAALGNGYFANEGAHRVLNALAMYDDFIVRV